MRLWDGALFLRINSRCILAAEKLNTCCVSPQASVSGPMPRYVSYMRFGPLMLSLLYADPTLGKRGLGRQLTWVASHSSSAGTACCCSAETPGLCGSLPSPGRHGQQRKTGPLRGARGGSRGGSTAFGSCFLKRRRWGRLHTVV